MAASKPDSVDVYDGRTVETYRLHRPRRVSGNPDILLNIEDEGYTAQWLSQKPVDAFHEVLDDYASNGLEAVAAFETGCRGNFRQEGPMEELLSENSSYYPDECTYLRAENSGYSIAWERESPHNSITLSVDSSNTTPLEIYFAELWVDERSDSMDELVDDAIDIIEENI